MANDQLEAIEVVDEVFSLLALFGHEDYIGEAVSQEEHAFQSAELAQNEGYPEEVVIAALLHDFGHFCVREKHLSKMGDHGIVGHERVGAEWLRQRGFPETVCRLVELHVQAKRYLTFKDPSYLESLSSASLETLRHQGGVMTAGQAAGFEKDPLFKLSIKMRQWDEKAKVVGRPIPPLAEYRELMKRVLNQRKNEG